MHKKAIVLTLILVVSAIFLQAETTLETTLEWKVGKDTVIFNETVSVIPDGYIAILNTSVGEYDRQVMDTQRSVLEWQRTDPVEGMDIEAVRQGEKVTVKGTYKGKPYNKTHNFGTLPWYVLQEASYEELYKRGQTTVKFWAIDRKRLSASEFKAEKLEDENIFIMGKHILAVKYSLSVSGVPLFLFQAHFWLRKTDGRFLKLDAPAVLGLPASEIELTSEKTF